VFVEIGITDYKHLLIRVIGPSSPLEYASDADAEGDVDVATNGSYATPTSSSPVRPEESIVGDNSPAEEHLAGAGSLVPIEEVEEVPDSESDEVPEENETPLQIREQPPAYSPVRRGQRSMRGGRIPNPYAFRCHCFPYTADLDARPTPLYSRWEIPLAKRRRTADEPGGEDGRSAKRVRVVDADDEHKSDFSSPWPSPRSDRGLANSPGSRARSSPEC